MKKLSLKYLKIIETHLKKAKISHKKLQQGDVISTLANISKARKKLNYKPKVNIYDGIKDILIGMRFIIKDENNLRQIKFSQKIYRFFF